MVKGAREGLPWSHHWGHLSGKNNAFPPLKSQWYPNAHQVLRPTGKAGSTSYLLDFPQKRLMEENPLVELFQCFLLKDCGLGAWVFALLGKTRAAMRLLCWCLAEWFLIFLWPVSEACQFVHFLVVFLKVPHGLIGVVPNSLPWAPIQGSLGLG